MSKEAILWTSQDDGSVVCELCNHFCRIGAERLGKCGVRKNIAGRLHSLNYGRVVAMNVDPIEKKPFFHFLPGSKAFSVASSGCNFSCQFCQNYSISQNPSHTLDCGRELSPKELIPLVQNHSCSSIAHTYTEPTIYFEHAIESAELAKEAGVKTLFVSNGFMGEKARDMMVGLVDAINVDLKAFSDKTYREVVGGRLQPVLDNIAFFREKGVFLEITTLIITDLNDGDKELRDIAAFIAAVDPKIPWHVSRFHPDYNMMDRSATATSTIRRARDIGKEQGLHYVYSGNIPGDDGESSYCYNCGSLLVKRLGFRIVSNEMDGKLCPRCSAEQNFVI